jgi:hypothetical protein
VVGKVDPHNSWEPYIETEWIFSVVVFRSLRMGQHGMHSCKWRHHWTLCALEMYLLESHGSWIRRG